MEENEEFNSKDWRDRDMETMIAMCGEMELEFLKNAKKQGKISKPKIIGNQNSDFIFCQFGLFKGLGLRPFPP